jgi:hypothetical protein
MYLPYNPSRRNFLRIAGTLVSGTSILGTQSLTNAFAQQPESDHFKLIKNIVRFYYGDEPILDKSKNGLFLKVIYARQAYPLASSVIEGFLTRLIFEGEGNEIIGVSSYVPHPHQVESSIGPLENILSESIGLILSKSALRYIILNPHDPDKDGLPTIRGGYDGEPTQFFLEFSNDIQDISLDGRLQGVIQKTAANGNPDEIRRIWSKYTRDDLAEKMTLLLKNPPFINRYTTEEEVSNVQNIDYLYVLRKLHRSLGKRVV